jgi:hypothetical protein
MSGLAGRDSIPAVTLLGELYAFYQEHRRCGELESKVTEDEPGWVLMSCTCGGRIARQIRSAASAQLTEDAND